MAASAKVSGTYRVRCWRRRLAWRQLDWFLASKRLGTFEGLAVPLSKGLAARGVAAVRANTEYNLRGGKALRGVLASLSFKMCSQSTLKRVSNRDSQPPIIICTEQSTSHHTKDYERRRRQRMMARRRGDGPPTIARPTKARPDDRNPRCGSYPT